MKKNKKQTLETYSNEIAVEVNREPASILSSTLKWLELYKEKNNVKGVVLGLSGGKDSTTVAMMAKKVWKDNVFAVLMPNGEQADIDDSLAIAKTLNLRYRIVNIKNAFESIISEIDSNTPYDGQTVLVTEKSKTNIAPRLRMTTLYAIAQSLGYLVIGTGNLSESAVGWTTKFGDNACDFNPIGHIACTEVIEIGKILAKEFNLDEKYIVKSPSDGLTGKTDEENLGFTYEELDKFILDFEEGPNAEKIKSMIKSSAHKRYLPAKVPNLYDLRIRLEE